MKILGISAFYHDSAATLLVDGKIVASAQEERFTRIKHDKNYPKESIKFCLDFCELSIDDIDYVCFYEKPFMKFDRLIKTHISFFPSGYRYFKESMIEWLNSKIFLKRQLLNELKKLSLNSNWKEKLVFSEHHLSHAASAFYPSPFESSAILTIDGVGEWTTTSYGVGKGNNIDIFKEIHFPHSLGLLYSAFTSYLGFKVNSGEYKLMGLAAYGDPIYADLIKDNLLDIKDDGSFRLDMSYFGYGNSFQMTTKKFHTLFGSPPRMSETDISQRDMDLAASIQLVTEEIVMKLSQFVLKETGQKNLVLAGGVALNCVANGKLLKEGIVKNIWIQPAAGDAGGALGAALATYYKMLNNHRIVNKADSMEGSYLGPEYTQKEVESSLNDLGANFSVLEDENLLKTTCNSLINGKAVGWHQGRMEFGPRALGSRSILGDPRSPEMQKTLNLKVKYRESFRPFAPSILYEALSNWFDLEAKSPYMGIVSEIKKIHRKNLHGKEKNSFGIDKLYLQRSSLPAITHVDYSARIQTVHKETNPKYHALISKFNELTGCPVLINTSFNIRGEPIVNSPKDAFRCFMGTDMDVLVIGNCVLEKEDQDSSLSEDYKSNFKLD
jgi:carbamoyltransferase